MNIVLVKANNMKKNPILLNAFGINLREAKDSDKLKIYNWRNLEHVRSMMREPGLISKEDHLQWFKSLDRKKNIILIYHFNQKDIGVISIKHKYGSNHEANLGAYVGDINFLGSPYNVAAILLAYDYCFKELTINKIKTSIHKSNDSALSLNKTLGFIKNKNLDELFDEYTLSKESFEKNYNKLIKLFS
tara:strand:- start:37771 stop:38337 length:567 start_codon:yes stop_codon:yes gene_type:complete